MTKADISKWLGFFLEEIKDGYVVTGRESDEELRNLANECEERAREWGKDLEGDAFEELRLLHNDAATDLDEVADQELAARTSRAQAAIDSLGALDHDRVGEALATLIESAQAWLSRVSLNVGCGPGAA